LLFSHDLDEVSHGFSMETRFNSETPIILNFKMLVKLGLLDKKRKLTLNIEFYFFQNKDV